MGLHFIPRSFNLPIAFMVMIIPFCASSCLPATQTSTTESAELPQDPCALVDCPSGTYCNINIAGEAECQRLGECTPPCKTGYYCRDGECKDRCEMIKCSTSCCFAGKCTECCDPSNDTCETGYYCKDGQCRDICEKPDYTCKEGELCEEGVCYPPCGVGGVCPDGYFCADGYCADLCIVTLCQENTTCIKGQCISQTTQEPVVPRDCNNECGENNEDPNDCNVDNSGCCQDLSDENNSDYYYNDCNDNNKLPCDYDYGNSYDYDYNNNHTAACDCNDQNYDYYNNNDCDSNHTISRGCSENDTLYDSGDECSVNTTVNLCGCNDTDDNSYYYYDSQGIDTAPCDCGDSSCDYFYYGCDNTDDIKSSNSSSDCNNTVFRNHNNTSECAENTADNDTSCYNYETYDYTTYDNNGNNTNSSDPDDYYYYYYDEDNCNNAYSSVTNNNNGDICGENTPQQMTCEGFNCTENEECYIDDSNCSSIYQPPNCQVPKCRLILIIDCIYGYVPQDGKCVPEQSVGGL